MPVILRLHGYRFFFYSNEGDPLEPAHIHVSKASYEAKIWLEPIIALARNDGFNARDLREIVNITTENRLFFVEKWNEYFA
jgi:hypothetical protein